MRLLKKITIVLFCVLLLLPILKFDFTEHAVSEIDNRELAANPLTNRGEDFTSDMENYVNDRIGFRNEMIYGYSETKKIKVNNMLSINGEYYTGYSQSGGSSGTEFGGKVSVDIKFTGEWEA